ncbi:MAG: CBS domain-containing protein [Nitrospira sp.]|nr:CBS domain-containing protein [Nitrospira sp.]
MKPEGPRTMEEARARRDRSSLYLESTRDEQLGLLPGEARKVKSAMSSAVTVASPKTSLQEAIWMMTSLNVPVIVVYDGRRLVGMITDRDIGLNRRVREAPQDASISGFMRTVPFCLEDDLLADAISVMRGSHSDWIPVLNRHEQLVGILSILASSL